MLRRALSTDLSQIAELMNSYVTPVWKDSTIASAIENPNNDVFVCEENGKVLAYLFVENVIDEGCITSVAVQESHRRQGIAGELIAYAIMQSRMQSIYLEVCETNKSAIELYAKCGFERISTRKKYYGEFNAYVLRKEL